QAGEPTYGNQRSLRRHRPGPHVGVPARRVGHDGAYGAPREPAGRTAGGEVTRWRSRMATSQVTPGEKPPLAPAHAGMPRPPRRFVTAAQIVLVRLRFLLALVAILLLVGYWDVVQNHWDKWTRPAANSVMPVSLDTEYWCPMCPGVLSEWPG